MKELFKMIVFEENQVEYTFKLNYFNKQEVPVK